MEIKLIIVGGDAKNTEVKLKLPTVLGRGREASLTLPQALVSRCHCELYEEDGHLCVRDLGSLNGTFIDNHRITEATILPDGHLLTVGTVTFRAQYDDDSKTSSDISAASDKTVQIEAVKRPAAADKSGVPLITEPAIPPEDANSDESSAEESDAEGLTFDELEDGVEFDIDDDDDDDDFDFDELVNEDEDTERPPGDEESAKLPPVAQPAAPSPPTPVPVAKPDPMPEIEPTVDISRSLLDQATAETEPAPPKPAAPDPPKAAEKPAAPMAKFPPAAESDAADGDNDDEDLSSFIQGLR